MKRTYNENRHYNEGRTYTETRTSRARAITAMKKRKAARTRRVIFTSIAATLAIALVAGVGIIGYNLVSNTTANVAPTATVMKLADNNTSAAAVTATQAPAADSQSSAQAQTSQDDQSAQPAASGSIQDGVYIDNNHPAPANTGTPAHVYAYGKTNASGDFTWDYNATNGNFVLACNYDFSANQYDFIFYGKAPGTSQVTLTHSDMNGAIVTEQHTVTVDNDLNVTVD